MARMYEVLNSIDDAVERLCLCDERIAEIDEALSKFKVKGEYRDGLSEEQWQDINALCDEASALAETKEAIYEEIDALNISVEELTENFCKGIRNNEGYVANIDEEIKRLEAQKKKYNARMQRNKDLMMFTLETKGIKKLNAGTFSVTVANNGGKAPLNIKVAPNLLPPQYKTEVVTVKPNNEAIRKAIMAGELSKEIAEIGVVGKHLLIK